MFTSLCVFSITLAASDILMDGALYVPAVIIDLYKASTKSAISGVEPLVIFKILVNVFSLSPRSHKSRIKTSSPCLNPLKPLKIVRSVKKVPPNNYYQ